MTSLREGKYGSFSMSRPPKFQLVDLKLGGKLEIFLTERREAGDSFETIARNLWDRTGVSVTGVTVSNWFTMLDTPAEAAS